MTAAEAHSVIPDDQPLPAVSVLMPVRNGARFLTEAIDSVLGQTLADFEFLIVDDGSTDDSVRIIGEYRDARIRLCRQRHAGIVTALNHGLRLARSGFIARMDHDDISLPSRLERQHGFLALHPEFTVVSVRSGYVTAAGRRTEPDIAERRPWQELRGDGLARAHWLRHGSVMFRRAPVLAVGGYRPGTDGAEDLDLWLRLHPEHRFALLNEHLFYFRRFARANALDLVLQRRAARRRVVALAGPRPPHEHGAGAAEAPAAGARERWRAMRSLGGDMVTQLNAGDVPGALAYVRALLASGPVSGLAWFAIGRAVGLYAVGRALRALRRCSGRRP